jgi:hypothetical protein
MCGNTALPPKISSNAGSEDLDGGGWAGSAGGLKIFSNNFRFAANVTKVLRQEASEGAGEGEGQGHGWLVVALEGDAARQPYYREGNGLNVGLYGAVGTQHSL